MSKLYGLGAAVVIVGALFKIQHYPGAGMLLAIGLITEATIFFFSAFEPLHEEPDWTLVYPELAGIPDDETEIPPAQHRGSTPTVAVAGSESAIAKFDELIESAEITPDLFKKMGKGLEKLSETTENINSMASTAEANNELVTNLKSASEAVNTHAQTYNESTEKLKGSVGDLASSYENTSKLINETGSNYQQLAESFTHIEGGSKSYSEQLEVLNKNLSALNAVYELQLQGANDHVKSSEALFENFEKMMEDLKNSADDTQKYREEVAKLSENLSALNTVYGNMLSAMNVTGR